jgi:hypothetical protein
VSAFACKPSTTRRVARFEWIGHPAVSRDATTLETGTDTEVRMGRYVCLCALAAILLAAVFAGCGHDQVIVRTVTVEHTATVAAEPTMPSRERNYDSRTPAEPTLEPAAFVHCDANIEVKQVTTTCAFANNVFYEYWSSAYKRVIRAYSPAADRVFTTRCLTRNADIECKTADGGVVRFSQAAVDRYSPSQADSYAARNDLGPESTASDSGTSHVAPSIDPSGGGSADSSDDFCTTHDCIPNYDNGRGSRVQCADGTYSHSGGIQGACSHHGGVG